MSEEVRKFQNIYCPKCQNIMKICSSVNINDAHLACLKCKAVNNRWGLCTYQPDYCKCGNEIESIRISNSGRCNSCETALYIEEQKDNPVWAEYDEPSYLEKLETENAELTEKLAVHRELLLKMSSHRHTIFSLEDVDSGKESRVQFSSHPNYVDVYVNDDTVMTVYMKDDKLKVKLKKED